MKGVREAEEQEEERSKRRTGRTSVELNIVNLEQSE